MSCEVPIHNRYEVLGKRDDLVDSEYNCSECKIKFTTESSLDHHQRKVHEHNKPEYLVEKRKQKVFWKLKENCTVKFKKNARSSSNCV